jgi:hypothetical protein
MHAEKETMNHIVPTPFLPSIFSLRQITIQNEKANITSIIQFDPFHYSSTLSTLRIPLVVVGIDSYGDLSIKPIPRLLINHRDERPISPALERDGDASPLL